MSERALGQRAVRRQSACFGQRLAGGGRLRPDLSLSGWPSRGAGGPSPACARNGSPYSRASPPARLPHARVWPPLLPPSTRCGGLRWPPSRPASGPKLSLASAFLLLASVSCRWPSSFCGGLKGGRRGGSSSARRAQSVGRVHVKSSRLPVRILGRRAKRPTLRRLLPVKHGEPSYFCIVSVSKLGPLAFA